MPAFSGGRTASTGLRALRGPIGPAALVAALAAAAAALPTVLGCSFIVDKDADQCATTADCTKLGGEFVGTTCVQGVCLAAATGTCGGQACCSTNQECIDRNGQYYVCRKDTQTCVGLLSTECNTVEGDYASDDAFMFGSVLTSTGTSSATGRATENAIKLAIGDFESTSNGLPPVPGKSKPRPLVLIGCSDDGDKDTSVLAARHLVEGIGVSAIIGANFSGITIKMATEVSIPDGAVSISPSATSAAITDLDDKGLVWRTSPSDVFQAAALVEYVPALEATIRTALGMAAGDKVRMAILHKGDAYGTGLAKAVEKSVQLNGKSVLDAANTANYVRFDYGDPDDPSKATNYGGAISAALDLEPHIILALGTTESVSEVFGPVEDQWTTAAYKPRFVFSDGGLVDELWDLVNTKEAADAEELRHRITGSVPGTTNNLFKIFRSDYLTTFTDGSSPDVFGAAGGYDATYLLAYSAVSLGATPLTGANLAAGLKKMIDGTPVEVGAGAINSTFPILTSGNGIDFDGASGPLDFNTTTGEAPSDIQIWCLPKDASGKATSGRFSGVFYDATHAIFHADSADSTCD